MRIFLLDTLQKPINAGSFNFFLTVEELKEYEDMIVILFYFIGSEEVRINCNMIHFT